MRPYRLRIGNLPIYLRGKVRFSDMNVGVAGQIYKSESQDAIANRKYIVIALEKGESNKCLLNKYREELHELDCKCKANLVDDLTRYNPLQYKREYDLQKCEYFLILCSDIHREYIDSKPEVVWQHYLKNSPSSHPDKKGKYLCTIDLQDGNGRFVMEIAWLHYYDDVYDWEEHIKDYIIAWCPMPEPYKGNLKV